MTKYITNKSRGVICLGKRNFIPGAERVEVTDEEVAHPAIAAYIKASKLALEEETTDDTKAKAAADAKTAKAGS